MGCARTCFVISNSSSFSLKFSINKILIHHKYAVKNYNIATPPPPLTVGEGLCAVKKAKIGLKVKCCERPWFHDGVQVFFLSSLLYFV